MIFDYQLPQFKPLTFNWPLKYDQVLKWVWPQISKPLTFNWPRKYDQVLKWVWPQISKPLTFMTVLQLTAKLIMSILFEINVQLILRIF